MKKYKVALSRAYIVTIEAENRERARRYTEFYIGDCSDASTIKDQQKDKFSIIEIEPAINDAIDVEEVNEHE
jgi:hypothetical protein